MLFLLLSWLLVKMADPSADPEIIITATEPSSSHVSTATDSSTTVTKLSLIVVCLWYDECDDGFCFLQAACCSRNSSCSWLWWLHKCCGWLRKQNSKADIKNRIVLLTYINGHTGTVAVIYICKYYLEMLHTKIVKQQ